MMDFRRCLLVIALVQLFALQLASGSETCTKNLDLVLVVEDSDKLPLDAVPTIKDYLLSIVKHYIISKTNTQIALQLYNTNSTVGFYLNTYKSAADVFDAIESQVFTRPSVVPDASGALDFTYNTMLTVDHGERSGVPAVVILVSFSSKLPPNSFNLLLFDPPTPPRVDVTSARVIQNAKGLVLALGIGPNRDANSLTQYAQGLPNYHDYPDFLATTLSEDAATVVADQACAYAPSNNDIYPCVMEYVQADVVFVVDISENMNSIMVQAVNSFFANTLSPFQYSQDGIQAALITYSRVSDIAVGLTKSKTFDQFISSAQNAMINAPCQYDERNIEDALENIYNHVLSESAGYRPDVAHSVFIITSACMTGADPTDIVKKLRTEKKADIHVITLGNHRGFWEEALNVAGDIQNLHELGTVADVLLPTVLNGNLWGSLCTGYAQSPAASKSKKNRTK